MRASLRSLACLVGVGALVACGDPELVLPPASGGSGGSTSSTGGAGGNGFATSSASNTSGSQMDPCAGVTCDPGLHCDPASKACVPTTCAELQCGPTEECQTLPNGGAICVDISCMNDVDCPADHYCNGTICVVDVCVPGSSTCMGADLYECPPNGSDPIAKFTCNGAAYWMSQCVDDMMGNAACTCQDDWDCPAFTECDAGTCIGTGVAPTCSLPPTPFNQLLPQPEIVWGGTSESQIFATGSPFEKSAQVVETPVVANLDDDNGDGLVNERDFPEIVFLTFCNSDISSNGVLRAIHGGGPNKGKDYFATCGGTVWKEGTPLPTTCATAADSCANATINSTAAVAVGDIDGDGFPEIVTINETRGLEIHKANGDLALNVAGPIWPSAEYANPAPAIANVDDAGFAEVVVGRFVLTFAKDAMGNLLLQDTFAGNQNDGSNTQGPTVCIANLMNLGRQEIVAGTTAYAMPKPPVGATKRADCAMFPPMNAEETAFCNGQLLVAWDGQAVNGATALPAAQREGFCAIADILGGNTMMPPGPQNPLDGKPDVAVISNGRLLVFDGPTGTLARNVALGAGTLGGPPNVDDFDGDGFPEIGTAFGADYRVMDLQATSAACPDWPTVLSDATGLGPGPQTNMPRTPPAITCNTEADCSAVTAGTTCNVTTHQCVCLYNGWKRTTEDDSSRVTGSSVFDFNGDGAAEVIYNDECWFRIYDGLTGQVYLKEPSESRTRIEYPVVADVDNDGNAEIVFATSNESKFCSVGAMYDYSNGIEVWGDPSDTWVSARRVWSEHAYHVTNVTESGAIPSPEPESWRTYNGRVYNTYRSNPRSFGVAPDLLVKGVQFSSPGATCGSLGSVITIAFEIANVGDLRVGPGVTVRFDGTWTAPALVSPLFADAAMTTPLEFVLSASLEPGESAIYSVVYDSANNSPMTLPSTITVNVDALDQERECHEDNNTLDKMVMGGTMQADLRVNVDGISMCPPIVPTTIFNDGSAPASNVVVRYYAGDPNQGGTPLHDEVVPVTIPPMGQTTISPTLVGFPGGLQIEVWAVVDPDNAIPECNDGNNKDAAPTKHACGPS